MTTKSQEDSHMKRYSVLTQLLAVAGAFIVVTTFAFSQSVATSIDFGVAVGITTVALLSALVAPADRRRTHVGLALASTIVGAWTILVALGIFSGAAQRWLDFAGGAAVAGVASVAGAINEASLRRRLAGGYLVPGSGDASANGVGSVPETAVRAA
jgi:hypothetical protein